MAQEEASRIPPAELHWKRYNVPPRGIARPEEWDDSGRLSIDWSWPDVTEPEKKKLIKRWCDILPGLDRVQTLWLHSRVPQRLFDAACQMRTLEALWIHSSSVKDLTPLCQVESLRFLNIGSSPQIRSIDPLATMTGLKWLQLENLKLITDLGPLAGLEGLDGLGFSGSLWLTQEVKTLKPLAGLTALKWLFRFDEIREAHRTMEANEAGGKMVVVHEKPSSEKIERA